eukprot:738148-Rhodomonas_salina.1
MQQRRPRMGAGSKARREWALKASISHLPLSLVALRVLPPSESPSSSSSPNSSIRSASDPSTAAQATLTLASSSFAPLVAAPAALPPSPPVCSTTTPHLRPRSAAATPAPSHPLLSPPLHSPRPSCL